MDIALLDIIYDINTSTIKFKYKYNLRRYDQTFTKGINQDMIFLST